MALVRACAFSELEDGEILKAEIDGMKPLAIYRLGDHVFATDDVCTHGEASLSEDGYIEDDKVICSWHDGAFDIRTGAPCRMPCMDPLRSYPVTIQDGEVFIEI